MLGENELYVLEESDLTRLDPNIWSHRRLTTKQATVTSGISACSRNVYRAVSFSKSTGMVFENSSPGWYRSRQIVVP